MLSKVDGEMDESALTPSDVNGKASKIQSPTSGKVVLSETNGQIKESLISVHDLSLIKVKDTMDISSFVGGEPRLLKLDKRVNYTTAFYTLMFESKIKTEKSLKLCIRPTVSITVL